MCMRHHYHKHIEQTGIPSKPWGHIKKKENRVWSDFMTVELLLQNFFFLFWTFKLLPRFFFLPCGQFFVSIMYTAAVTTHASSSTRHGRFSWKLPQGCYYFSLNIFPLKKILAENYQKSFSTHTTTEKVFAQVECIKERKRLENKTKKPNKKVNELAPSSNIFKHRFPIPAKVKLDRVPG